MNNIRFKDCPACHLAWTRCTNASAGFDFFTCLKCKYDFHFGPSVEERLTFFFGNKGEYDISNVLWKFETRYCSIYVRNERERFISYSTIKMPWLPYNISVEKLRKYILFS